MNFYQLFVRLCNEKSISPSAAIEEIGLKKSAVTRWKKGGNPTDATLEKICDYFGVTKDYFTEKKDPADENISRINEELFMKYAESLSRSDALELAQKLIALAATQE